MTARTFQEALPPSSVAYRVAEAAGISARNWRMMVYRDQPLTAEQLASLRAACESLGAELRTFGRSLR